MDRHVNFNEPLEIIDRTTSTCIYETWPHEQTRLQAAYIDIGVTHNVFSSHELKAHKMSVYYTSGRSQALQR